MPTPPNDPMQFRITEAFLRTWDALPAKGKQTIGENASAAGSNRDDAKNNLAKAANAGIAREYSAISPYRYDRTPKAELTKEQLALLRRIDQARNDLAA